MMNILDFIELEIEDWFSRYDFYKEGRTNNFNNEAMKLCSEKLEYLHKIKLQLEAWEKVKKYLVVEKSTYEEDYEETEYDYIDFVGDNIDPFHGSDFEEVETIKKALLSDNFENMFINCKLTPLPELEEFKK